MATEDETKVRSEIAAERRELADVVGGTAGRAMGRGNPVRRLAGSGKPSPT